MFGGTQNIFTLKSGSEDQEKKMSTSHNLRKKGSCSQIPRWKPPKGLYREILGFIFAFTPVFCPGTKVYSRLEGKNGIFAGKNSIFGGKNSILGGTEPKCTPEAPRLLLSFGAQSLVGGEHGPEMSAVASDLPLCQQ